MKENGLHEGCIEQIYRLFSTQLYGQLSPILDEAKRLRLDNLELRPDIQTQVETRWDTVTTDNLYETTDFVGVFGSFAHS